MCALCYIQKTDICSLIEGKILSLIMLLQYLFAYLNMPFPSVFWSMSIIQQNLSVIFSQNVHALISVSQCYSSSADSEDVFFIRLDRMRRSATCDVFVNSYNLINGLYRNSVPTCSRTKVHLRSKDQSVTVVEENKHNSLPESLEINKYTVWVRCRDVMLKQVHVRTYRHHGALYNYVTRFHFALR